MSEEELQVLSHEDLVELSRLIYKLLQWDDSMSWDEAYQKAHSQVMEGNMWMKSRILVVTEGRDLRLLAK